MEALFGLGHTLLSFVIILSVIVFIHEFGHYIIARLCGVKIVSFSIGFGKELFGFNDRQGTRWKFSMLPFGGYVKMFGDQDPASVPDNEALAAMSEGDKSQSFYFKPLWQKSLIVFGGPLFNFVTAILIFTYFIFNNGITSTQPIVGEVMPESAALESGLIAGDRFVSLDGDAINSFNEIPIKIMTNLGTPMEAEIMRDGKNITLMITPKIIQMTDDFGNEVEIPRLGIKSQELTFRDVGLLGALALAVERTYDMSAMTLKVLGQLITGQRGPEQLQGPIGIAKLSGQAADAGVNNVLWFIALISVNLGLVNLLPIPMLDGGHLLYYGIESVKGAPLSQNTQMIGFKVGFVLLISLMAFTIVNDIVKLV